MIFLILFFYLINQFFSFLPIWNLSNSAINLLSSSYNHTYIINDISLYLTRIILKKIIKKTSYGVNHSNFLSINKGQEIEVNFEGINVFIDFSYFIWGDKKNKIICPRGNFNIYDIEQKIFFKPNNFKDNGNWNLICDIKYQHFFYFYLNNGINNTYCEFIKSESEVNQNHQWNFKLVNFSGLIDNLYDYKIIYPVGFFEMTALTSNNGFLKKEKFYINPDSLEVIKDRNYLYEINVTEIKLNNKAIFENETNVIYFITYDNISNFLSGYIDNNPWDGHIQKHINNENPFEFIDEVEIKEMEFLFNSKFIYYSIYNIRTGKTYHGIYDIKLNKIMFNTNEDIDTFIPYSNNSMLAITKETAYRICLVKNKDTCIENCKRGKMIVDIDGNNCGEIDGDKYLLIPENIYINECNSSIFITNSSKFCGLCRDMNIQNKYKILNGTKCLKEPPDNTIIFNSKLFLLVCKEGSYLYDNNCVKCKNENCLSCNNESNLFGLCLACDTKRGYRKIKYNNETFSQFYDCIKEDNTLKY